MCVFLRQSTVCFRFVHLRCTPSQRAILLIIIIFIKTKTIDKQNTQPEAWNRIEHKYHQIFIVDFHYSIRRRRQIVSRKLIEIILGVACLDLEKTLADTEILYERQPTRIVQYFRLIAGSNFRRRTKINMKWLLDSTSVPLNFLYLWHSHVCNNSG